MFERTIEAQSLHETERRFGTVSAVALAHLSAVSILAIVAAVTVRPIVGPPIQPTLVLIAPRPDPPPGPVRLPVLAPTPHAGGRSEARRPVVPAPVPPATAPTTTPERLPAPVDEAPLDGFEGSASGSLDGGDQGRSGEGGNGGGGGGDGTGLTGVDPVPVTGEMVAPVRIAKVDPVYPSAARIARMTGTVVVQAVIGLDGRVESTEILASTSPLFDAAAVEAVRQWRYTPATMNGRPVRVYFSVRVAFVLR